MDIELAHYFLPAGILDYFNIISHKSNSEKIHFYLEEKNILPKEYQSEIAQSKGFLPEFTIEDFPLREKPVLLHIKRSPWTILDSGKIITRDWNLIAKGTQFTNEFATFLKDISR